MCKVKQDKMRHHARLRQDKDKLLVILTFYKWCSKNSRDNVHSVDDDPTNPKKILQEGRYQTDRGAVFRQLE